MQWLNFSFSWLGKAQNSFVFAVFDFKIRFLEGAEVMKYLESAERKLTLLCFLVLCD
jgi:hypothetical protein